MTKPYLKLSDTPVKDARPIAVVKGGKRDKAILYLCEDDKRDDDDNLTHEQLSMIKKLVNEQVHLNSTSHSARERNKQCEIIMRNITSGGNIKNEILDDIKKIVKEEFNKKKNSEISIPDGEFEIIPNTKTRECVYAAAPSGSGKSYWVSKYIKQYNKQYPKNPVYLFSKVENDPSLEGIKNLIKVNIDYELVDDPIDATELANSLVVFDDTDTIKDKEIRNAINDLKNDLLETGRHNSTHVVITSHLISNYKESRIVLNESHLITVYPSSGSSYQIKYALKQYFGLDSNQISRIFKLNSRAVTLKKVYPQMVIAEKDAYLLSGIE